MGLSRVVCAIVVACLSATAAEVVTVGGGSIAAAPPADHKEVRELFARRPQVEPALAGRALPTNDWWSNVLADGFPTKLYAMPAIVGADGGGVQIWYPQGWSDNGTEMIPGQSLRVELLDEGPPPADADRVVVDFEGQRWPASWQVTGNAFGDGPLGAADGRADNFVGSGFAEGFKHGGDGARGTLTTDAFTIDRDYLHLLVAGGSDGGKARIEVVVGGQAVASVSGRNQRNFSPAVIDLRQHRGKQARLRLVDETGGGWGWIGCDHAVLSMHPEAQEPGTLKSCKLAAYGDWTIQLRLHSAAGASTDCTLGRGLPYVWLESDAMGMRIPVAADAVSGLDGRKPGRQAHALRIERDGRRFALVGPPSCRMAWDDGAVTIDFRRGKRVLAVALVDDWDHLETLVRHALVVPRETRFDFTYTPASGLVQTTFTTQAEALAGDEEQVLQGWLPHHWRGGEHELAFSPVSYATQRGQLKCVAANQVAIAWRFPGLVPALPLREPDPALKEDVRRWLADRAAKDRPYGDDTYWGGKDPLYMARMLMMARAQGDDQAQRTAQELVTACLSDWFTYTPGEEAHFFARYPEPWRGLVGFKTSYGSGAFTDNHFHYGYFTLSAALLGLHDPAWLQTYGPVATEVAKQYANWDRSDERYPYLRTFDPWGGHSYAGGLSSPGDGNNQESSSEAMQSWAGLFLLGTALGDEGMQACGAMGYAIEGEATDEYWNDWYGNLVDNAQGNHPPAFEPSLASVMRDRDIGHWTWFSGEPIHIYGIQWLPVWTSMHYFGRRAELVRLQVEAMRRRAGKGQLADFRSFGGDWGNIALGYLVWADPSAVRDILDQARTAGHDLGGWQQSTVTRYLADSLGALGQVDWQASCDLPTALVFVAADGRRQLAAWNAGGQSRTVTVTADGRQTRVEVPAGGPHLLEVR